MKLIMCVVNYDSVQRLCVCVCSDPSNLETTKDQEWDKDSRSTSVEEVISSKLQFQYKLCIYVDTFQGNYRVAASCKKSKVRKIKEIRRCTLLTEFKK